MKKMISTMALLMMTVCMFAKDVKTVVLTTLPQMSCENCENRIKGNLRFEKGVKDIQTSVPEQKVTVSYDAEKTSPEKIIKAMKKIGYQATVVDEAAPKKHCGKCAQKDNAQGTCGKKRGTCNKQQTDGCGKQDKACAKQEGHCAKKEGQCAQKQGGCCKQKTEGQQAGCCKQKAEGKGHCGKQHGEDCKKQ